MKSILKILTFTFCISSLISSCNKTEDENPDQFTDSRDGHVYKTVTIGTQTWMAENMAYLPAVNNASQYSQTTPCYYVYDYNVTNIQEAKTTENYQRYGVLYNWPAAMNACPAGWHLPSDGEWTILEKYLIANGYNYDGTTTGDKIAKALADNSWWEYAEECEEGDIAYSLNKNNSSGFSALPGGSVWLLNEVLIFDDAGYEGFWWTSTQIDSNNSQDRSLWFDESDLFKEEDGSPKNSGASVRCIKD